VLAASENHLLVHSRVIGRRRTAVSFANTRTPPERKGGVFGTLMQGFLDDCWRAPFAKLAGAPEVPFIQPAPLFAPLHAPADTQRVLCR